MLQFNRNGLASVDRHYDRECDETRERIFAGLPVAAKGHGLERIDHVVLGNAPADGRRGRVAYGAGDGNRTHVSSLGSYSSTIELRPHCRVKVYADRPVLRNAGAMGSEPFPFGKGSDPALHQKLPLKLANSVASCARFCRVVALRPMLLCRPNSSMRAPTMAVA